MTGTRQIIWPPGLDRCPTIETAGATQLAIRLRVNKSAAVAVVEVAEAVAKVALLLSLPLTFLNRPPPHNLLWDTVNRLTIARVTRMVDPVEGSAAAVALSAVSAIAVALASATSSRRFPRTLRSVQLPRVEMIRCCRGVAVVRRVHAQRIASSLWVAGVTCRL